MADRFFGQGTFRFRVVVEVESSGWGTQGPTLEEAQQRAREHAESVVRNSARRGFPECDDVVLIEFTCVESDYDIGELSDECPVCAGKGTEAGRACGACMGRGFFSPSTDVVTSADEKAPF